MLQISVEWIGNLEKRYEGVNFVDADPDPVQFISRGREFPKIIRKTRLDIGVQVQQFINCHRDYDDRKYYN